MELETALRCNIPFVAVIMNNCCLGSEYHGQKERWQRNIPEVLDFYDINYAAIAQAFGAHGERVTDPKRIPSALQAALESGKPAIVEVMISKETSAPNGNRDAKRLY
jgi:acetolactate synthase-1/2/3 large subunit